MNVFGSFGVILADWLDFEAPFPGFVGLEAGDVGDFDLAVGLGLVSGRCFDLEDVAGQVGASYEPWVGLYGVRGIEEAPFVASAIPGFSGLLPYGHAVFAWSDGFGQVDGDEDLGDLAGGEFFGRVLAGEVGFPGVPFRSSHRRRPGRVLYGWLGL